MTIKGWRTLLVALAISVAGVLQMVDWATIVPQNKTWTGAAMVVVGLVMAGLRSITTTSVGAKE